MSTAVNGGEAAIGGQRVELDAAPFLLPACGPPDPDTSTRGPSDFAATPGESEDEPEPRPKPRRSDCLPDALRGHDVLPADADRPEDLVGPPHGHDTCPKPPAGIFTVYGLGMDEGNTYVDDPHSDLERRAEAGQGRRLARSKQHLDPADLGRHAEELEHEPVQHPSGRFAQRGERDATTRGPRSSKVCRRSMTRGDLPRGSSE